MRADRAHADVQLSRDLRVGAPLRDQGDEFAFSGAELVQAGRRAGGPVRRCPVRCHGVGGRRLRFGGGEHECVLGRRGRAHRRAALFGRLRPVRPEQLPGLAHQLVPAARTPGPVRQWPGPGECADIAAHTVTASAGRWVDAHR